MDAINSENDPLYAVFADIMQNADNTVTVSQSDMLAALNEVDTKEVAFASRSGNAARQTPLNR